MFEIVKIDFNRKDVIVRKTYRSQHLRSFLFFNSVYVQQATIATKQFSSDET